jgi:predicted O-methyltransferase YrrM
VPGRTLPLTLGQLREYHAGAMPHLVILESTRKLCARLAGLYALNVYLPLSAMDDRRRSRRRARLGATNRHTQPTRLPQVEWHETLPQRSIYLVETQKRNGNVRLSELGLLAQAAAACTPGREIVEIGTFDGRTTMNLSTNAPNGSAVFTLDLPPDQPTQFTLAPGERMFVEKALPGERFRNSRPPWSGKTANIEQLLGDSATFDWSQHFGKAGLVFVDGSHAKDYARKDSETALRLVAKGGIVIWHDYGVWEGVTQALEELDTEQALGLRHVRGTSLVVWRAPGEG